MLNGINEFIPFREAIWDYGKFLYYKRIDLLSIPNIIKTVDVCFNALVICPLGSDEMLSVINAIPIPNIDNVMKKYCEIKNCEFPDSVKSAIEKRKEQEIETGCYGDFKNLEELLMHHNVKTYDEYLHNRYEYIINTSLDESHTIVLKDSDAMYYLEMFFNICFIEYEDDDIWQNACIEEESKMMTKLPVENFVRIQKNRMRIKYLIKSLIDSVIEENDVYSLDNKPSDFTDDEYVFIQSLLNMIKFAYDHEYNNNELKKNISWDQSNKKFIFCNNKS